MKREFAKGSISFTWDGIFNTEKQEPGYPFWTTRLICLLAKCSVDELLP